ncbi:uncharacterized protein CLUP02_11549 [Colletotrichum lupini]|uniref:Uncharacterized protein n=1 Tax=Colletotrichum lupini TaxID=145971 RepID=A0A9Q8SZL8_9PEZI|nr:uncharacterized protein CLUP02_11549 [Colletotrichum lupini]UQC86050.1 hypothetical protein CLUP02_11549 [Colletotrichum lupini]
MQAVSKWSQSRTSTRPHCEVAWEGGRLILDLEPLRGRHGNGETMSLIHPDIVKYQHADGSRGLARSPGLPYSTVRRLSIQLSVCTLQRATIKRKWKGNAVDSTRSQVPPTGDSTHVNLARVRKDTSPRVPPPLATQSLARVDRTHTICTSNNASTAPTKVSQPSKKLSGSCLLALPIAACPAVIVTTLQLRSTARRRTRPGFTIGRPLTASLGPIGVSFPVPSLTLTAPETLIHTSTMVEHRQTHHELEGTSIETPRPFLIVSRAEDFGGLPSLHIIQLTLSCDATVPRTRLFSSSSHNCSMLPHFISSEQRVRNARRSNRRDDLSKRLHQTRPIAMTASFPRLTLVEVTSRPQPLPVYLCSVSALGSGHPKQWHMIILAICPGHNDVQPAAAPSSHLHDPSHPHPPLSFLGNHMLRRPANMAVGDLGVIINTNVSEAPEVPGFWPQPPQNTSRQVPSNGVDKRCTNPSQVQRLFRIAVAENHYRPSSQDANVKASLTTSGTRQWARHITTSCQSRPPKLALAGSGAFVEEFNPSLMFLVNNESAYIFAIFQSSLKCFRVSRSISIDNYWLWSRTYFMAVPSISCRDIVARATVNGTTGTARTSQVRLSSGDNDNNDIEYETCLANIPSKSRKQVEQD